jgi:division protein CdvB (Snf7/Vps24/ESCRT-III family)
MRQLFILVTVSVRAELHNTSLEVVQSYGLETLMVNGQIVTRGDVTLIQGPKEEFQKLLDKVGQLWISTSPMLGDWDLMIREE